MDRRRGGYLTTTGWQSDARAELARRGISPKQFAEKIGCAQSTMHDLLNKKGFSSHLIPKVNRFFGWPPPSDMPRHTGAPPPSPEAAEAAAIIDQLPEALKKAKLAELKAILAAFKPSNE